MDCNRDSNVPTRSHDDSSISSFCPDPFPPPLDHGDAFAPLASRCQPPAPNELYRHSSLKLFEKKKKNIEIHRFQ